MKDLIRVNSVLVPPSSVYSNKSPANIINHSCKLFNIASQGSAKDTL